MGIVFLLDDRYMHCVVLCFRCGMLMEGVATHRIEWNRICGLFVCRTSNAQPPCAVVSSSSFGNVDPLVDQSPSKAKRFCYHLCKFAMKLASHIYFWILQLSFLILAKYVVSSRRGRDPCDLGIQPKQHYIRSDQITVLMNGFSESRIPLLLSVAASYSSSPLVSSILILWGNPLTPSPLLSQLSHNLSAFSDAIHVIRQSSSSLNARFLPRPHLIKTRAVLICDDDVEVDSKSLDFAFRVWASNLDRLVGFFVRSHDLDLSSKNWIYTVHPNKYSIVLTKLMILKAEYLFKYSCGGPALTEMRKIVDKMQNCEDILMNFVVADEVNAGPILVGAERLRDYGDARNDENNDGFREVGLSSRKRDHRMMRGFCIREFHRVLRRMPLRYSHGKVVDSVEEQGLCMKGSRLVHCDDFSSG